MVTQTTNFDRAAAMMASVPKFSEDGRRLARELYQQLSQGEPVARDSLADAVGVSAGEVTALLEGDQFRGWVFYDDEERVIGFRGLAIVSMPHQFVVAGRMLYTWCAMDSLFIPELLGKPARVKTQDPRSGGTIKLNVTPEGIESVEPEDTVMSIVVADVEVLKTNPAKVMSAFCHHIYFLESPEVGTEWASEHGKGAFVVSLAEAFELGRLFNKAQFGEGSDDVIRL